MLDRQIMAKPLPRDFYKSKGWHESLVKHYSKQLPQNTLEYPLEALTACLENIINVYGNFPEDVAKLLKQAVDPLFAPEEYHNKIYKVIKQDAIRRKDPYTDRVAEGLYFIRTMFEKKRDYVEEYFHAEIDHVPGETEDEKIARLAEELSMIAKVHARQVVNMISKHCGNA
ncbi:MAG: hypothetical protein K0R98_1311 [Rickettsiaceae bacterium]|jgi:hypothetical protein|nr:hypothetical protein [Rickettsiaceae bacterium]